MDAMILMLVVVIPALTALGILAQQFGVDSRPAIGDDHVRGASF